MQIPIQNNNSNNGKKLSAGEEYEVEEIEVTPRIQERMSKVAHSLNKEEPHYFDAKTFNPKKSNMISLVSEFKAIPNNLKYGIVIFIIVLATITKFSVSEESEADRVARVAKYDYQRKEQIKESELVKQGADDCIKAVNEEMGKDTMIVPCNERTLSGATLIPRANASEAVDTGTTNSGTVTTASSVVPQGFKQTKKDEVIMERICSKAPNSPLCGKWDLYTRLKDITMTRLPVEKYGRMWEILLGISFAESHVGQNMAKDNVGGRCFGRFNLGGTKYQIKDDNTREYSRQLNGFNYGAKFTARFTDQYGCNLYPFQSYEEYWETKVNGMRYGYPTCIIGNPTPITCISYSYVDNPNVAEPEWIRNVASFLVTDEELNVAQP